MINPVWLRFIGATAVLLTACSRDDDPPAATVAATSVATTSPAAVGKRWMGPTMEGNEITVSEASTIFVGNLPEPISIIEDAVGCDPVVLELQFWMGQADETEYGQRASAYARYAQEELKQRACPYP